MIDITGCSVRTLLLYCKYWPGIDCSLQSDKQLFRVCNTRALLSIYFLHFTSYLVLAPQFTVLPPFILSVQYCLGFYITCFSIYYRVSHKKCLLVPLIVVLRDIFFGTPCTSNQKMLIFFNAFNFQIPKGRQLRGGHCPRKFLTHPTVYRKKLI